VGTKRHALIGLALAVAGCGGGEITDGHNGTPDGSVGNPGPYSDFPSTPFLDTGVPNNAPALFGAADATDGGMPGAGPCLTDPEIGSLFPRNWLRMRFHFTPAQGQNLFELRVHAAAEVNDLVVYTTQTTWTMPLDLWTAVTTHLPDQPITISIRGAVFDGTKLTGPPAPGTKGDVTIAPVNANGTIVYWTTTGGSSLKGFQVGQESVSSVLTPQQVKMQTGGNQVTCIGCHTSTPDGLAAGFTAQGPWGNALASIDQGNTGNQPSYVGAGAIAALSNPQLGIQTYSRMHWSPGDRIEIAPFGEGAGNHLAWFDLEATDGARGKAYDYLTRNGDPRGAGAPVWSHDGQNIVYVSTDTSTDGRLDNGDADLYVVPYNNRNGGDAKPIAGAADPNFEEYYPALSADDKLIAFDRIPPNTNMYNQPQAEVHVIPIEGGTATRIVANDPPKCSGAVSPGVTNSWPKWSPEVLTVGNKSYYWLTFSSTRGEMKNPQLYVAAVVVDRSEVAATITNYHALYLWNQPATENNHTPAWDVFQIPLQ
jgi:hypothetical protein